MKTTAKSLLNQIENEIAQIYDQSERTSIGKIVLEEILNVSRHQLPLNPTIQLSIKEEKTLSIAISKLKQYQPVQYVTGKCHFFGRDFKVNPSVLIPRPETEELVGLIIDRHKQTEGLKIVDIGTGSGCIAISLAAELPTAEVTAIDISEAALAIATENATQNSVQLKTEQLDIIKGCLPPKHFDIIVSNPPYITESERQLMHQNVLEHEPGLALFVPNENPLKFYEAIAKQGIEALRNEGWIYCEINELFGAETVELFEKHGGHKAAIHKDMQGKDRIVSCQKT